MFAAATENLALLESKEMITNSSRSANSSLDWSIFDKYFKPSRNGTRGGEDDEVSRFFLINGICVLIIMLSMSLCYMSHACYNKWWKPFYR